jgi:hypothetical protein
MIGPFAAAVRHIAARNEIIRTEQKVTLRSLIIVNEGSPVNPFPGGNHILPNPPDTVNYTFIQNRKNRLTVS